ncbi:MAG: hypothetical protein H6728_12015 [Myxococcales bacterium]|nr:hypothetical protein [Myxococcales bacterium]
MTAIPIWLHVLVYVLGLGGGAGDAERLRQKAGGTLTLEDVLKRAPYLYGFLPLVVLPLVYGWGLSRFPRMEWYLPLWLGYWMGPLIWGVVLFVFMFFSGMTVKIAFSNVHPERWKLPIVGVLLAITVEYGHFSFTQTAAASLGAPRMKGVVVLQTTPVSCAAASAATLFRSWGRKATEREMVELLRTNGLFGTGDAHIVYGFAKVGVVCQRAEWTLEQLPKLAAPQMIFVKTSSKKSQEDHAAVFAGMRRGQIVVWDPLFGEVLYTKKKFSQIWKGRGLFCKRPTWSKRPKQR